MTSGLLSSHNGHLGNLHDDWLGNTDGSEFEAGTECPFLVAIVILGFLSIFK